jgi:hypothetical protein
VQTLQKDGEKERHCWKDERINPRERVDRPVTQKKVVRAEFRPELLVISVFREVPSGHFYGERQTLVYVNELVMAQPSRRSTAMLRPFIRVNWMMR